MGIIISPQSMSVFRQLIADAGSAPFLLKALRSIEQDPLHCGRPFRGVPNHQTTRIEIIALPRDKQLRLIWNPTMHPPEVILLLVSPP